MQSRIAFKDLIWSQWVWVEEAKLSRSIEDQPGLYRIRRIGHDTLDYVGQTTSLRKRILSFRRHLNDTEMPWNDPHVAAARFWALRQEEDFQLEVSVAVISTGNIALLSFECLTISYHRLEYGFSPTFNFGRMPDGWTASSRRSKGIRGTNNQVIRYSSHFGCIFSGKPNPLNLNWLELDWVSYSEFLPQNSSRGVYIGINWERNQAVYIGESTQLRQRIKSHIRDGVKAEWYWLEFDDADDRQRLEIENDLLSSYISYYGEPPTHQFNQ